MSSDTNGDTVDLWDAMLADIERDGDFAAREHLAAGRPIYYAKEDTPAGLLIKRYPDGRRDLVRYYREGDEVLQPLTPVAPVSPAFSQRV